MSSPANLRVRRVTPVIGAEISGLDLRKGLSDEDVSFIRNAFCEYLVLFITGQDISAEDQIRFGEYFGPTQISGFQPVTDDPAQKVSGITVIDQSGEKIPYIDMFHTDQTFSEVIPLATILRSVVVPESGGDTCFVNMYAAYEALSPKMRGFLDGLSALHSSEHVSSAVYTTGIAYATGDRAPQAVHPVVTVHPETGKKLLFVNSHYTKRIMELTEGESRTLLDYLFNHVKQPAFGCRYRWSANTLAIWDNRAAQHCAIFDYTERRYMYRSLVGGSRPLAATA